jgi:hypothetical protein
MKFKRLLKKASRALLAARRLSVLPLIALGYSSACACGYLILSNFYAIDTAGMPAYCAPLFAALTWASLQMAQLQWSIFKRETAAYEEMMTARPLKLDRQINKITHDRNLRDRQG